MIRWSWLILIVAGLIAVAARAVADSKSKSSYKATAVVRDVNVQVTNSTSGYPTVANPGAKVGLSPEHFLNSQAASGASAKAGISADKLLSGLDASTLSGGEAQLTFTSATRDQAAAALNAYMKSFVALRQQTVTSQLQNAMPDPNATVTNRRGEVVPDPGAAASRNALQGALNAVPSQISVDTTAHVTKSNASVSPGLATLAGLLAGLSLGILLALAFNRFDPRVRRASDLDVPAMDVFEVTEEGLSALRVDLELTAVGDRGGIVTVTPADGDDALADATELARSFADAGVSAVLLDMGEDDGTRGVRNFLDGTDETLRVAELGPDLGMVSAGASNVEDASLLSAARVKDLLVEARKTAQVVIVHTPVLDHHPESLLFVGAADGAVLVVRPSTQWHRLDREVDRIRRVAGAQVRLWFERKPMVLESRSRAPQRVAQAGTT